MTAQEAAESTELVMDTAELLDSLSADARDICERLKYQEPLRLSRKSGCAPRDALRNEIKLHSAAFETQKSQAGLSNFFPQLVRRVGRS